MPIVRLVPTAAIAALSIALVRVVAAADPSPSPAPAAVASAAPSAAAAEKTVNVKIENFAYSPDPITVAAGTKVVFKNYDTVAHTVQASDGTPPAFDSGNLDDKASWSHVFAKAGTYKYFCAYHTYMTGTIIVK